MAKKKTTTTKAKTKSKKKEVVDLIYYGKKNYKNLFISEFFVYDMFVYELTKNVISLVDNKETNQKEFKGFGQDEVVTKDKKRYLKSIELIGAPISFLEENKFYKL